jgi:uncharacterized protein YukJ
MGNLLIMACVLGNQIGEQVFKIGINVNVILTFEKNKNKNLNISYSYHYKFSFGVTEKLRKVSYVTRP